MTNKPVSSPTATHPTVRGAGELILAADCWSCGAVLYKMISRRRRRHRFFSWSCPQCEVSWSAAGRRV